MVSPYLLSPKHNFKANVVAIVDGFIVPTPSCDFCARDVFLGNFSLKPNFLRSMLSVVFIKVSSYFSFKIIVPPPKRTCEIAHMLKHTCAFATFKGVLLSLLIAL